MQWAIEKLAKYRSKHVIEPVKDWNDDIRLGYNLVCSTDEIRVHPKKGGGFYHDPGEIAQLSRISRGILPKIDWSIPVSVSHDTPTAIEKGRALLAELDAQARAADALVEDADAWTAEELLQIANQSGMAVSRG